MYLNKSDNKRRFSVYVYTDTEHYVRVNNLYETYTEAQRTVQELNTEGTWLYNQYNQYPHTIIVDSLSLSGTIQELIQKHRNNKVNTWQDKKISGGEIIANYDPKNYYRYWQINSIMVLLSCS